MCGDRKVPLDVDAPTSSSSPPPAALRYDALGNHQIFTPHLDWLCDEGIAATRAYSDCPVCMPARATIMSGKHGHTMGYVQNGPKGYPLGIMRPAQLLTKPVTRRVRRKMHFHPERTNNEHGPRFRLPPPASARTEHGQA